MSAVFNSEFSLGFNKPNEEDFKSTILRASLEKSISDTAEKKGPSFNKIETRLNSIKEENTPILLFSKLAIPDTSLANYINFCIQETICNFKTKQIKDKSIKDKKQLAHDQIKEDLNTETTILRLSKACQTFFPISFQREKGRVESKERKETYYEKGG